MFVDAVWANLSVFGVGQVFAWLFLRSGRFWVGAGALAVLWAAIDWWLVQRFLLSVPAQGQQLAVCILQATAVLVTGSYLWACLRRWLGAPVRSERFRRGITELVQGQWTSAEVSFRQLVWSDPWDVPAWIGRGDAFRRLQRPRRARRCYRRAAGVDVQGQFADLLAHRLELLRLPAPTRKNRISPALTEERVNAAARHQTRDRKAVSGS